MNNLQKLYKILLKEYGPQGWWPVINSKGKAQYHLNTPRNRQDSFEIAVGAILTQNTNWKNVERALTNLKQYKQLSKKAIKEIEQEKLAQLIRPSGYFNQKAKKLKEFVNCNKSVTRENLLQIWGLGPETADSILLYAYNQPIFVIDAYTKRVLTKLNLCKEIATYDELQNLFHKNLKKDVQLFKEYHALLVEAGKNKGHLENIKKKLFSS